MSSHSLTSFLLGNQYLGIEHFSMDNGEKVSILAVGKNNNELIIKEKNTESYTGDISKKWVSQLPCFVVINTNQVIQKEITGIENSDEKLLHKAFPNLKWDEFYYEIWRLKNKSFIVVARKTYIDEIISNYKKQGILIAGISLGICSVSEIIDYTATRELYSNNQLISLEENNRIITSNITGRNTNYDINGLTIENSSLLAFSGILRLLINGGSNTGNLINYSIELFENFQQKSLFSKGSKVIIGILLTILLINFFSFSHYYKLAEETSGELFLNRSSRENFQKIKQRIGSKEEKLKSISGTRTTQSSLIINDITSRIPNCILLKELIYHPLEKKIKSDENISTQDQTIIISGNTIDNLRFTNWIEELEKLKWINQVLILKFGKSDQNETEFTIKLDINEIK